MALLMQHFNTDTPFNSFQQHALAYNAPSLVHVDPSPVYDAKVNSFETKRRKPDMWTMEERWIFIETFLQNGRDFKLITERVKTKNKEQVRQYYYRALEKVNKLLKPYNYCIRDKSCNEAVLALKCFWSLEKKAGYGTKNIHGFAEELYNMLKREKQREEEGTQSDTFNVFPFPSNGMPVQGSSAKGQVAYDQRRSSLCEDGISSGRSPRSSPTPLDDQDSDDAAADDSFYVEESVSEGSGSENVPVGSKRRFSEDSSSSTPLALLAPKLKKFKDGKMNSKTAAEVLYCLSLGLPRDALFPTEIQSNG